MDNRKLVASKWKRKVAGCPGGISWALIDGGGAARLFWENRCSRGHCYRFLFCSCYKSTSPASAPAPVSASAPSPSPAPALFTAPAPVF